MQASINLILSFLQSDLQAIELTNHKTSTFMELKLTTNEIIILVGSFLVVKISFPRIAMTTAHVQVARDWPWPGMRSEYRL